eukprot:m.34975 g.34975  ORF g.34975 m.34975 type:complete len:182 (-) comp9566_c0_seq2:66-611(-)
MAASATSTPGGIPAAQFVDDVDKFMATGEWGTTAEAALKRCDEMYSKYKFMESQLLQKASRLKSQTPEIKSTLDMIRFVKAKSSSDFVTDFRLADNLYASARVPPTEKVCLWLGANVMLEYTVDEAETMLKRNYDNSLTSAADIQKNLDFLRDQITTMEVNMARIYNWDVQQRRNAKAVSA